MTLIHTGKTPAPFDPSSALLLPYIPDAELVRRAVSYGMPLDEATEAVLNPGLRLFATCFYFDTIEAATGDKDAKERVDYCRHTWNEMTKRGNERE